MRRSKSQANDIRPSQYTDHFKNGYLQQYQQRKVSPLPLKKKPISETYPQCVHYYDAIYQGAIDMKKRRDGPGILFSDQGSIYIGGWNQNLAHGQGLYVLPQRYTPRQPFLLWQVRARQNQRVRALRDSKLDHPLRSLEGQQTRRVRRHLLPQQLHMEFPQNILVPVEVKQYIRDFERNDILSKIQEFEADIYSSSIHAQIKCVKIDQDQCYVGYVEKDQGTIHGLGLIFRNWNIRYIGQYLKGQLNGIGKAVLDNDDFYIGTFKEGLFYQNGALFKKKDWTGGRWSSNELTMKQKGGPSHEKGLSWIKTILTSYHLQFKRCLKEQCHLEKVGNFEELLSYNESFKKIQERFVEQQIQEEEEKEYEENEQQQQEKKKVKARATSVKLMKKGARLTGFLNKQPKREQDRQNQQQQKSLQSKKSIQFDDSDIQKDKEEQQQGQQNQQQQQQIKQVEIADIASNTLRKAKLYQFPFQMKQEQEVIGYSGNGLTVESQQLIKQNKQEDEMSMLGEEEEDYFDLETKKVFQQKKQDKGLMHLLNAPQHNPNMHVNQFQFEQSKQDEQSRSTNKVHKQLSSQVNFEERQNSFVKVKDEQMTEMNREKSASKAVFEPIQFKLSQEVEQSSMKKQASRKIFDNSNLSSKQFLYSRDEYNFLFSQN